MTTIPPSPSGAPASATPEATPSAQPEAGGQSQQAAAPAPVTKDILKQALTELAREDQRQRDMMEARITKQLQTVVKAAEAGGVTLTAEQQAKARANIAAEVQEELQPTSPAPAGEAGRPAQAIDDAAEAANPLEILANQIMDYEGIEIDEDDPEAKSIDWTDKKTISASLKAAIESKRRRTAVERSPLSGGRPADNPIAGIKDTDTLWALSRKR